MYEAAEQQLAIVRRKARRLGDALQEQIDSLKRIRSERLTAHEELESLRARLLSAEARAFSIDEQHDAAERSLRKIAEEFSVTQLLQKRYANTLAELSGRHRVIVRVSGAAPAPSGEESARDVPNGKMFAVADACTVVELERRRSFVFDVAFTAPPGRLRCSSPSASLSPSAPSDTFAMSDAELADAIGMDRVVSDVLAGINTIFMTFGPLGGGKTEVLFGSAAAKLLRERRAHRQVSSGVVPSSKQSAGERPTAGLLAMFVHSLFDSLAAQSVTHFSICCSFAELAMNQTVDLLLRPHRRGTAGPATVRSFSADAPGAAARRWSGAAGMSDEVLAVPVTTAEETLRVLHEGLERTRRWWRGAARETAVGSAADSEAESSGRSLGGGVGAIGAIGMGSGGVSHSVFSLTVESFNSKGHYRRAVASFADLCGPAARATRAVGVEAQWVDESLQVLCDAIAATSGEKTIKSAEAGKAAAAAFDRLPSAQSNALARFLRPVFGGNAKAVMVCCVDADRHTREQVLNSLSYAYYFKSVPHQAQPYDIPPELQRLNLQMTAFLSAEDEEEEEGESAEGDRNDHRVWAHE